MNSTPPTPAPDPDDPLPDEIESAAAAWLARRDAGLSPAEQADFYRWLAADRRHTTAWRELEASWHAFDEPRFQGHADRMLRELVQRRRRRRWRATLGGMAAVAVVSTAIWVLLPASSSRKRSSPASSITARGARVIKPERRVFPDGSVAELNAGAQIEVKFSASRREIPLLRGDAHLCRR